MTLHGYEKMKLGFLLKIINAHFLLFSLMFHLEQKTFPLFALYESDCHKNARVAADDKNVKK